MDFDNIFNTISSSIPAEVAGVSTLYIGLGSLVVIILIWAVLKVKKTKPKRELLDPIHEDVYKDESVSTDTDVAEQNEEDGFMPDNISSEPQDIHVMKEEPKLEESAPALSEAPVKKVQEEIASPAPERRAEVKRKKRESQRNGKKISKANFSDFNGKRLLIAEDNLINQKVINGVLNESGIDIVMADDGQYVLDILEEDSDFEIILMDAHMPRVDGFEATREIRKNSKYDHIAVIALSGDTAVDDIRHMREAGMEEALEKPLKMDALYDVMSMYYSMDEEESTPFEAPHVKELEISVDINDLTTLDYDLGLDICGNDEEMYKELLKEFFIAYKDSSKKLHAALVDKNYHEVQSIMIDVKGTASNMGAKQFIFVVDNFLEALSQGDTKSYPQHFKDYQTYLLSLLKSIQAAFKV